MARGSLNHLALTASDLDRSVEFYDKVLGFMGYVRGEVQESTQQLMKTRLVAWGSPTGAVTLRPAKVGSASKAHDRTHPGLNHLAFNAADRADVERMYELLREIGAQILDPPEYPYFPGYYAVYFTDPDGIKFEFVFWPQS
jgi:glyoxylase I family protein